MADAHTPDPIPILNHLEDWYGGHHQNLTAVGVTVGLQHSPPGWDKASIALSFEAGSRLASLIIWETGETELDLADADTGMHVPQHHDINSPAAIDDIIRQILTWVGHPSHSHPST